LFPSKLWQIGRAVCGKTIPRLNPSFNLG
jgi:hypothetical protein